ncbi:MAG TPA: DNA polymerase III subunit gamma/tau [Candidatus Marinimicrobia bacterium]|jgi:DNA polymerase-3 subunit gamma/tau|nr:DNA polymerase III subunit gamma/tau [Candidatus Neomarinimicrobiota bacterium]HJL74814.1 DNA polymerase III subunit gamma/tau [Candidatus Neomarinimicrobiota bacterium]HJM69793.1 DNA polymerase III subunit gamma/tau [Candidatus Neomarinimicrobiota bacterium]|tara:strand:- start:5264 stop:6922 length:1659 start_codon:yes stop_codon:yes gene_type:complete
MTYQVLSLKWRPQTFNDVVGQDHVTQTLKNAFAKERVGQGYVFTGPRGVGKTTMARLMAKGLNCQNPVDHEPCNTCSTCLEITESRSMDVLEIDGASNRGIDEIRNLRENIKFPPMNAKFKVYIIDEVHMLTTQAFNALLRTLEEPPPHGKFIMCTTDIHKMPATIISRCQRYDFNRISSTIITERMKYILDEEKITYDNESLSAISLKADGSMRDALSILDQVISFAGEKIEFENITKVLGLIPYDLFFDLTKSIKEKHAESLVDVLNKIRSLGTPLEDVVNGLNQHLRNLLIGTVVGAESSLEVNPELQERYAAEAKHWERRDLMRFSQVFSKLEPEIRRAAQPQILLEMNLLKMLEMDQSVTIEEILNSKPQSSAAPKPVQYEIPEVVEKKPPSVSSEKKTSQTKVEAQAAQTKKGKVTPENQNDESAILDLETIKSNWHKMITKISSIKTSVAMVLEHTLPMELNNKKLDVAVVDQPRFSLDRLERNRQLIENTFKEIFKQSMRITFLFNEEIEEDIKHEIPDAPGIPTKGDPVVNRVIEVFDGEILR